MYPCNFESIQRAFRSVVDRLLCMLKVKGSNPLMSMFFSAYPTLGKIVREVCKVQLYLCMRPINSDAS